MKIVPLNNSVSRSEIVRLKKDFLKIFNNETYYKIENLSELLNVSCLNEEIYIRIHKKSDLEKLGYFIFNNKIPTNNIVIIEENCDFIDVYKFFDRENKIKLIKIYDEKFDIPNNYYTLLYIEKMNDLIMNRFYELNIDPNINRFVVFKDNNIDNGLLKLDLMIKDYLKFTKNINEYDILIKFVELNNYNIDNISIDVFKNYLIKKTFNINEIKVIKRFLSYYLLGVKNND